LPRERLLLDEYARRAASGRNVGLKKLVDECHARIVSVYERFASSRTPPRVGYAPPNRIAVESYIERQAPRLGRRLMSAWHRDEDVVVDRYAQALLDGKYERADFAAVACGRALARLRRRWRTTAPERYSRSLARSDEAVHTRICELAHAHRRTWPKAAWTEQELQVLRKWIPWYRKYRRSRAFSALQTVADGAQEELERINCRRTADACYGRFQKAWSQLLRQELSKV
jgi:hypothetical protein